MLKKIFNNNITAAAFLIALSSLISRLLGVFRDRILAGEFGAGDALDIYYAAFRIPDLIFNLLVLGALSAGFIPIFTKLLNKNKTSKEAEAWNFANNVINILIIFLIIFCGLGIIFSPFLIKLIAPGFSNDKQILTVSLTKIMFLSPIFLGISGILGGILQSFKRFFIYSLSPILYNIGIIIGALFFVPIWGLYGLAWGVVLGAFFHMLIQFPAVINLGFRPRLVINFHNNCIKKIWKIMVPRVMAIGVTQINLLIITIIASTLASGSLTVFNFANNLQYFPIGIFGISFAVAAFPSFSETAFNKKDLVFNFSATIRKILFFIIPTTVLLIILRSQIIRIILGTGRFTWHDTILTMNTLGFFAISLFAQATIPLLTRVFYARHNSKTPFFIGLSATILNIILSLWLINKMGVVGLALSFSISSIFNFILLWLALRFQVGNMDEIKILISTIKFSIATIACGITAQGMKFIIWPFIDMSKFWGVFTQCSVSAISGILVYFIFCSLLRGRNAECKTL
ncbi:MAG: murein biosynthesis integral membrane protein MurJ [Patescibacteria group bacterium]